MRVLLTQQIERNVPRSSHIFGSMVLPDAAAVFIEGDVQRPMELILNIPMLANHGDEGGGRPHQTGNVDAIVTRDRRLLMRHTNRFDDNHGLETRPLRQLRQGSNVSDSPDSSPYRAAVRVIKGIKKILGCAPCQLMFDILMKVLFDRSVGLFVIAFQGQEIITALVPNLARNGRLTAHGIDRHNTPFEG